MGRRTGGVRGRGFQCCLLLIGRHAIALCAAAAMTGFQNSSSVVSHDTKGLSRIASPAAIANRLVLDARRESADLAILVLASISTKPT
jgi:hypothetical protein